MVARRRSFRYGAISVVALLALATTSGDSNRAVPKQGPQTNPDRQPHPVMSVVGRSGIQYDLAVNQAEAAEPREVCVMVAYTAAEGARAGGAWRECLPSPGADGLTLTALGVCEPPEVFIFGRVPQSAASVAMTFSSGTQVVATLRDIPHQVGVRGRLFAAVVEESRLPELIEILRNDDASRAVIEPPRGTLCAPGRLSFAGSLGALHPV